MFLSHRNGKWRSSSEANRLVQCQQGQHRYHFASRYVLSQCQGCHVRCHSSSPAYMLSSIQHTSTTLLQYAYRLGAGWLRLFVVLFSIEKGIALHKKMLSQIISEGAFFMLGSIIASLFSYCSPATPYAFGTRALALFSICLTFVPQWHKPTQFTSFIQLLCLSLINCTRIIRATS